MILIKAKNIEKYKTVQQFQRKCPYISVFQPGFRQFLQGSSRILKLALFLVSRFLQKLNNVLKVPRLEKGWKALPYTNKNYFLNHVLQYNPLIPEKCDFKCGRTPLPVFHKDRSAGHCWSAKFKWSLYSLKQGSRTHGRTARERF
jgi:hypothetical protein